MNRATSPTYDILVVGAGPAGLSATDALARRGLRVGCVAPSQPPRWPNTYGVWLDELRDSGLDEFTGRRWSTVRVDTGPDRRFELDRIYALIDKPVLRDHFRERATDHGVDWIEGTVTGADSDGADGAVEVATRGGTTHRARMVIDATGHGGALTPGDTSEAAGYQTAFGIVVRGAELDRSAETMTLMDHRPPEPGATGDADGPPTFLYTMDIGDDRKLFEETVLVSTEKPSFEYLERRLRTRLEARDIEFDEAVDTERVVIPMGGPLPEVAPERGVLPFGAAARLVHPATGYMVGRTLQAADPMAEAVAEAFQSDDPPSSRRAAVRRGWRAIWPDEVVRSRHLLTFGLETLASMDAGQTREFFDSFFSLPDDDWRAYLSGTAPPRQTARIMWKVFSQASLGTKSHLTRMACSTHAHHLIRSLAA
jgi:lycopene cyclase-like protein